MSSTLLPYAYLHLPSANENNWIDLVLFAPWLIQRISCVVFFCFLFFALFLLKIFTHNERSHHHHQQHHERVLNLTMHMKMVWICLGLKRGKRCAKGSKCSKRFMYAINKKKRRRSVQFQPYRIYFLFFALPTT